MKRFSLRVLSLLVVASGLFGQAFAADLPPLFEGPSVLPVGKSTFSLGVRYSPLEGSFFNQPARDRLLREITWSDAIAATPESQRPALRSQQVSLGRQDDDVLAREFVQTAGYRVALRPLWLFGLGERWTVGARIPVVAEERKIGRRTDLVEPVSGALPAVPPAPALAGASPNGVRESVVLEGLDSGSRYRLGDVEIFGQYLIRKSENWALAARPKLVLPTAPPPDPFHIDPLLLNEGQTDVGVELIAEWRMNRWWSLLATEGYLAQLPDRVALRVPDRRQAILQGDLDRNVRRDSGDILSGEILLRYFVRPTLTVITGLQQVVRGKEKFSGTYFSSERYQALADGTSGRAEHGRLGISYTPPIPVIELVKEIRLLSAYLDVTRRFDLATEGTGAVAELGATFAY